jgi:hypothetical protein
MYINEPLQRLVVFLRLKMASINHGTLPVNSLAAFCIVESIANIKGRKSCITNVYNFAVTVEKEPEYY